MEEENREEIRNVGESGIVTFFKIILKIILGFWVETIIFAEIIVTFSLDWILTKFNAASLSDLITQLLDPLKLIGLTEMLTPELLIDGAYNIFLKSIVLWLILNILYYMISRFLKAKTALKIELVLAVIIGLGIYACLSFDLTGAVDTIKNLDTSKYEKYNNLLESVSENSEVLESIDLNSVITEDGQINKEEVNKILENEEVKQEVMNVLEDEEIRNEISTILESQGVDSSILNTITEENLNSDFLNSEVFNDINLNTNTINTDMISPEILNTIDMNGTDLDIDKINDIIKDYNLNINAIDVNTIYSY